MDICKYFLDSSMNDRPNEVTKQCTKGRTMPLIIIAGTPCVGKTYFANELAAALNSSSMLPSSSSSSSIEVLQEKVIIINEGKLGSTVPSCSSSSPTTFQGVSLMLLRYKYY